MDATRARRRAALPLLAALLATVLAGCGSKGGSAADSKPNGEAGKPARQVLDDAVAALKAAPSARAKGTASAGNIDLSFAGTAVSGTISQAKGGPLQLVSDGSSVYVKGDAAFYQQFAGPDATKVIGDKWIKAGANAFGGLSSFTLASLADSLGKPKKLSDKTSTTVVNGQQAVVLTDDGDGSTVSVALTGDPLPLRVTNKAQNSQIDLTGYGSTRADAPPPASKVVDLEKLQGAGGAAPSPSTTP